MEILASLLGFSLSELKCQSDTLLRNLGIDSLTATRVRGAIVPMPSYQVLYGLTVAQVADRLSASKNQEPSVSHQTSQQHSGYSPFALTPMQESYVIGASQGCPCQVY